MSKHEKFFSLAQHHAELFSKDPDTKVAAIVVDANNNILSVGYNGLPREFKETCDRWKKPNKYTYVVHAEANAISTAARNGVKLEGGIMISTLFPCNECAKLLIQAGIKQIVTKKPDATNDRWLESFDFSTEMLEECGVGIKYV